MSEKFEQTEESPYYPELDDDPGYDYISPEEGREIFDSEARRTFNMSGEEFLRRYDAGEFTELMGGHGDEHSNLVSLVLLIPLVR